MHATGNTIRNVGGAALVAVLRDDPSVWWSWTETTRRVLRLHAHGDAFGRGTRTGRDAAVDDLADRLRWSYACAGVCRERREWRAAAEELLRVVGGARWSIGRSVGGVMERMRGVAAALL